MNPVFRQYPLDEPDPLTLLYAGQAKHINPSRGGKNEKQISNKDVYLCIGCNADGRTGIFLRGC